MAYVASLFFAVGSFCKNIKAMRIAMLCGGVIFIAIFLRSDLTNSTNLANLLLNVFNVVVHVVRLIQEKKKKEVFNKKWNVIKMIA